MTTNNHNKKTVRMRKGNRKVIILLFLIPVLMFGFGFALVPMYNVFCNVFGINGKTSNIMAERSTAPADKQRTILVQFVATNNEKLPWIFKPNITEVKLHPGQNQRITYFAQNISDHTMTIQAIPSVSPGIAAKYLRKTECFCFTQQTLKAGESMDMPILFHIDRDLPKNINVITLSYTIFDTAKLKGSVSKRKQGKISG